MPVPEGVYYRVDVPVIPELRVGWLMGELRDGQPIVDFLNENLNPMSGTAFEGTWAITVVDDGTEDPYLWIGRLTLDVLGQSPTRVIDVAIREDHLLQVRWASGSEQPVVTTLDRWGGSPGFRIDPNSGVSDVRVWPLNVITQEEAVLPPEPVPESAE